MPAHCLPPHAGKDRSTFAEVFRSHIERRAIDTSAPVLVIGGSGHDVRVLDRLGFTDITLTNLGTALPVWEAADLPDVKFKTADAEDLDLPDRSYDLVFVHESLHHCRSPHRALCEMLRVSRRHVVMLEPNESHAMTLLVRLGFSAPYETAAVIDNGYRTGGVSDSHVPNFLYRWSGREVEKTTSSFLAERIVEVDAYAYWDFNAEERDLELRSDTRIGAITKVIGTSRFLTLMRRAQRLLNRVPPLRREGNKFFACITISDDVQPWLTARDEGTAFREDYQPKLARPSLRGTRRSPRL